MEFYEGYQSGLNLGGWLSQFDKYDENHFNTYITRNDINKIGSWKFDHIRLPVDYIMLEDVNKPCSYLEKGFEYIDRCLEWCAGSKLNVILDLHSAPGFDFNFDALNENTLFSDEGMQNRFIELWKAISRRYAGVGDNLVFELLNQVFDSDSSRWNSLVKKTLKVIRDIDANRKVMIGSNFFNSVYTLKEIDQPDDRNIVYNFHFYEPTLFTHQRASWIPFSVAYDKEVTYPGEFPGLKDFLDENPQFARIPWIRDVAERRNDINLMLKQLEDAYNFVAASNKPLYCGEYGVIDFAPQQSKLNWLRDFIVIANSLKIGRAYWTYKGMDFGLADNDGNLIKPDVLEIVTRR